ncbi:acyclic terpene utilization AtuA family protein [Streptomyces sp. NPDC012888]|uniref:acyclic terpene utilization AtuA family protein n=1 Tax=Streptomyces sp. NPDC012888 TaxID=3364855 RepID=UPI003691E0DF
MREMLTGGPLDVLTGDYLAELTMLVLGRDRLKDPGLGYAKTFLRQLDDCLGLLHEKRVRLVTNAGGLNPAGLADAVRAAVERAGVPLKVAHVEGDDLMPYRDGALTANAYLGGAGITACLRAGADVVVTGRVTDAALVTGPAAWWFDWAPDDWDRLAGAVVAGHVLECGTQATGGNYAFFARPGVDVRRPGFPLAEIAADGSSVITKHPGTGGLVTPGTVTAQLLYETQGVRYLGPDVTARLDTVRLTQEGPDRVRVGPVAGEPPPSTLKVGVTRIGGWRNEVVFVLTGLDVEAKAELVRAQLADVLAGVESVSWTLARTDHPDADTQEAASALLRLVVRDPSPDRVGRALTSTAIELALASYPGFHVTSPPTPASPYGTFTADTVPATSLTPTAVLPTGTRVELPAPGPFSAPPASAGPGPISAPAASPGPGPSSAPPAFEERGPGRSPGSSGEAVGGASLPGPAGPGSGAGAPVSGRGGVGESPAGNGPAGNGAAGNGPAGNGAAGNGPAGNGPDGSNPAGSNPTGSGPAGSHTRAPLGLIAGARSGDKGGDANLGVWVETDAAYAWLAATLTVTRLKSLLPETGPLRVTRHPLPALRALNFTIEGLLGAGAASGHRFDPQAKALGEWLRSRHLDIPTDLVPSPEEPAP